MTDTGSPNMTEGIGRRIAVSAGLIFACRIVGVALSLLVAPTLIATLGFDGYGVWEVFQSVAAWALLASGGSGMAVILSVSEGIAQGDRVRARRDAGIGIALNLLLAVAAFSVAWGLRVPILHLLRVPPVFFEQALFIFPFVAALLFVTGIIYSLNAVLIAYQQSGLATVFSTVNTALSLLLSLALLQRGWGLTSLLIGQVVGLGLNIALSGVAARWLIGAWLLPAVPTRTDLARLWEQGKPNLVITIADLLGNQCDKLLLSAIAGPTWTGYYAIATRLTALVGELSRYLYMPLLPAAAALHASGDRAGIHRLYGRATLFVGLGTGLLAALVAGLHLPIFMAWFHRSLPQLTPLVLGLTLATMLHQATGAATALCRGIGQMGLEARYTLANLIVNATLTLVLTLLFGASGTVAATVIAFSLTSLYYFWTLHSATDLPRSVTYQGLRGLLAALPTAAVLYPLTRLLYVPGERLHAVLYLLVALPVGAAVYLLCAYALRAFSPADFKGLLRRGAGE